METMTFCIPCLFGLEGLVGDELRRLELSNVRVEDRRVFFEGDFAAMAKANLCCRMGERVMILLAEFDAHSFEDLFQGVKAVPLERFIPKDGAFPVKGYSLNSQLHSVPDCQAIVKKAAVTRLGEHYGLGWLPETGETYQLRFSIMKDHVELFLDTSGVSLHKRGYRREANLAPLHHLVLAVGCRRRKQSALQVERAAVTGEAVKFGFCHGVGKLLVQFGDLRAQSLGLRFEVFLLFLQSLEPVSHFKDLCVLPR